MRTLVISDLHLGTTAGGDVLRLPELREVLWKRVRGVDRLVLLGDIVELRHGPADAAVALAEPFFRELAELDVPDVVYLPGNHDWIVLGAWLSRQREAGRRLRAAVDVPRDELPPLARRLRNWLPPLRFAYPGTWLREDVYATHGHYSDLHTTVPTFERLAAGAMRRYVVRTPDAEAVLAPIYAWLHEVAQEDRDLDANVAVSGAGASYAVWRKLGRDPRRDPRALALWVGIGAGVKVAQRLGFGELSLDLTGAGLRRGGLHGMHRALQDLGVAPRYAIWGHSHRSGPWPGDDLQGEWRRGGTQLINTGSWLYSPHFVTAKPNESPYWPGVGIWVDDQGPPRPERLLGLRTHVDFGVSPGRRRG